MTNPHLAGRSFRLLKPGQSIRLLAVPQADLVQRQRELATPGMDAPGWTADTIESILAADPVVTISRVDEYGVPWFDYEFPGGEIHTIAIMDDESWEYAEASTPEHG